MFFALLICGYESDSSTWINRWRAKAMIDVANWCFANQYLIEFQFQWNDEWSKLTKQLIRLSWINSRDSGMQYASMWKRSLLRKKVTLMPSEMNKSKLFLQFLNQNKDVKSDSISICSKKNRFSCIFLPFFSVFYFFRLNPVNFPLVKMSSK